jgi:hypothetical protein
MVMLSRHSGLAATTRLKVLAVDSVSAPAADWMLLFVFGSIAAFCSACLELGIQRVPGHAILRVVFPLALGFAVVPRRGAGTVMGGAAFLVASLLSFSGIRGEGLGVGAMTSLVATGPLLDWTLRRAHSGWQQYAGFTLAGIYSNLLALVVRGTLKATGYELPGRRPLVDWLSQACVTYLLCGLAAGLISAVILFYGRRSDSASDSDGRQ